MKEDPTNTIQVWRPPLKSGEVLYYMYHVHIGVDDVAGKLMRPGNVVPRVDADGWLCWEIPDNVPNRRLVRDAWSDPALYTVIHVDATSGAGSAIADAKAKFNGKPKAIAPKKPEVAHAPARTVRIPDPAPAPAEDEVSAPDLANAGSIGAPRGIPTAVRG